MALHVLAYNLTRVMNILGVKLLIAAMRAACRHAHRRHQIAHGGPGKLRRFQLAIVTTC
jgi:hypothetical protein